MQFQILRHFFGCHDLSQDKFSRAVFIFNLQLIPALIAWTSMKGKALQSKPSFSPRDIKLPTEQ